MKNIKVMGKNCCGCHGCEQSCPVNAISFRDDEDGFAYPVVSNICVECGMCIKRCPMMDTPAMAEPMAGYAAYLANQQKLRKSSSGGIFVAAAEAILSREGTVYGCAEARPGFTCHTAVDRVEQLSVLQGSKYTQSDMTGIYEQVKRTLERGKAVLFTGSPCQVAGLLYYTGEHENLYTADIICHGVPSRKMYREYLSWLEKKTGATVKEFLFRSKEKHGWSLTYRVLLQKSGKIKTQEKIASLSPYYRHFLQGVDYRESCYVCPYACRERVSSLTLGDFWGVEHVLPAFSNPDGMSAVLVNTRQGQKLWEWMKPDIVYQEVALDQIIRNNGQLQVPTKRPAARDTIYKILNEQGYDAVAKAYTDRKEVAIDGIKDMIPNRVRQKVKAVLKRRK